MNNLQMSNEVSTLGEQFIADAAWVLPKILMNTLHMLYEVSTRGQQFIADAAWVLP